MRVSDGSTVWAQSYGDGWALASDVGMTGIGRPVLLGMFRDHIDLGGVVLTNSDAALDTFVLELANDGSFRYAWQLGGTASMQPTAMAVDSRRPSLRGMSPSARRACAAVRYAAGLDGAWAMPITDA